MKSGYTHAVYVLKDSDGRIRYVGISSQPDKRLARHMREAKSGRSYRHNWLRSLAVPPTLEIVEWTNDWHEAEPRWIAKLRAEGCKLVNGNEGGKSMRQTLGRSEAHPYIKRVYRRTEEMIRWMKRRDRPEKVAMLEHAKEKFRGAVALARARGPDSMARLEKRISERMPFLASVV